jgi:hypothetical protein
MSTQKSSEKHTSGEHLGYIDIAGKRVDLAGTSGHSTLPQVSAVIAARIDLTIAGKRVDLAGTSGHSILPQVDAVVATRIR